ncbi:MAG: peptide-binding protein [Saprospiraceae bacterium]|nr:MAG: peptide-binding protein [Saprospiraceae bacterium]
MVRFTLLGFLLAPFFIFYANAQVINGGLSGNNTIDLYVSTTGQAGNNGRKGAPVADIQEAVNLAEQLKKDDPNALISINLLPGDYQLSMPIRISPALNGLAIMGSGASEVRIKGTVPLALKWEKQDSALFVANVPNDLQFDQLVVNDRLQTLARYPNYDEAGGYWQGHTADALSKARIASWQKPKGAIFHVMHNGKWGGFHYRVKGVDEQGEAILEGGHQNNRPSKPHPIFRMVENVLEELDSPGEWYFDADTRKLYYWPPADIDMQTAKFEGIILKNFIEIKGDLENPVKDITIKGIKFEYAQRTLMETYEPLLRSDWTIYRGGAIFLEGTENCLIADCEFTNLGGNVIFISGYNKQLKVTGNHIHDCGASAICFVGDPSAVRSPSFQYGQFVPLADMDTLPGPKNELYPRNCMVHDNLIHRIGRIEKQTAGVQISMAMDITVSHNSINDVPRAGINIGDGTWGGHIIEFNDVFNTVLETGDHGSFNSWGRDRFWHPNRKLMDSLTTADPEMPRWDAVHTTTIRNNRFRCDHGWDIDLDDGSSNYHIYNNLCLNGGIKLREGFYRVVENNITVNNSLHPHVWFANSDDVFRRNIVQVGHQDVILKGWGKEMNYNLFPNEESLLKAQIYNIESNSSFGDPQFNNPQALDFTVSANSPALKLGFVNFPMDAFGVQKPSLKALAKTPEIPLTIQHEEAKKSSSPTVAWLRNDIKSVDSKEEQSAYGLNTPEGVIMLGVWKGSPVAQDAGLKIGDVILEVDGEKVKNVKAFFNVLKAKNQAETLKVLVMRNQAEHALTIRVK